MSVAHVMENASNSTHRSWMPPIIGFVIPLFVARLGNLWRFSSAKLESRGGRVKRIARTCVSWQPKGVYTRTIKKKRNGDTSSSNTRTVQVKAGNNGCKTVLDRVVLQEVQIRHGVVRPRAAKRFRESGRVKKVRALAKSSEWADDRLKLELTCEGAFAAMYFDQMPRIYNESGQLHEGFASDQFNVA